MAAPSANVLSIRGRRSNPTSENTMNKTKLTPFATTLVLSAISAVYGQDAKPVATVENASAPQWLQDTFDGKIPEALAKGKFNLNARLRYEYADAQDTSPSHAPTIRARFGFTSAPVYGFQGMLEGETIQAIGDRDNYGLPGGVSGPGKTIVADPVLTQLNQAWLSYSNWKTTLKGGRQRIKLDNDRFIGNVGWRQNEQTYDAVYLQSKYVDDLTFNYGYLWEVNRIFGDVLPPAATRDFTSDSHIINVSYTGLPFGKLTGYSYILAFENSGGNSTATYGANFSGSQPVGAEGAVKLGYWLEYAHQTGHRNQTTPGFDADYYKIEGSGTAKGFTLGGGYEVLGSDGGAKGFGTPLATLHAHNGWADAFLATPATGLTDAYAFAGTKLPGDVPVKVVYHKFDADFGGGDHGYELDFVASKALGKHWKATAKYAWLDGKAPVTVDTQKLWLEIEFNF